MNLRDYLDRPRLEIVFRFRKAMRFPRFSMERGEEWRNVGSCAEDFLREMDNGRVSFAGGVFLPEDVEIVYSGPCRRDARILGGAMKERSS